MSEKIVQLNEEVIKGQIKELVRGSVEETLNELLEAAGFRVEVPLVQIRHREVTIFPTGNSGRLTRLMVDLGMVSKVV